MSPTLPLTGSFENGRAGAAIGCLVGLYVDRSKSPRGKMLLLVAAISMLAIGTLPLLVAFFIR